MNTLLKPLQVREILLKKGVRTFTVHDFESIFHTSASKTKYFLETQTEEGLFARLKQGIYALKTDLPSEEEIANSLYKPSYISFEYALAYWGILPEMPYGVTSATTKPTRQFTANNTSFAYYSIKEAAYTGYMLIKTDRRAVIKGRDVSFIETQQSASSVGSFFMAEPEKALIDYLYFVSLGKRAGNDRLHTEAMLDKKKLQAYSQLYKRKKLTELVQEYL